jgi:hypothetical protein
MEDLAVILVKNATEDPRKVSRELPLDEGFGGRCEVSARPPAGSSRFPGGPYMPSRRVWC